jgi:hypothetical protein
MHKRGWFEGLTKHVWGDVKANAHIPQNKVFFSHEIHQILTDLTVLFRGKVKHSRHGFSGEKIEGGTPGDDGFHQRQDKTGGGKSVSGVQSTVG